MINLVGRISGILLILYFSEVNYLNFSYLAEQMEMFGIAIPPVSLDLISEQIQVFSLFFFLFLFLTKREAVHFPTDNSWTTAQLVAHFSPYPSEFKMLSQDFFSITKTQAIFSPHFYLSLTLCLDAAIPIQTSSSFPTPNTKGSSISKIG